MANIAPTQTGRAANSFLQGGPIPSSREPAPDAGTQALARMDSNRLARWAKGAQTIGAFAYQLAAVENPQERTALAQRYIPILLQNQFLTPEMAQNFDLSDAGLAQLQAMALNVSKSVDDEARRRAGRHGPARGRGTGGALADAIAGAKARRQGDYRAFLEEWVRRNGDQRGAQAAWTTYADANPIVEAGPGGVRLRQAVPWRQWFKL